MRIRHLFTAGLAFMTLLTASESGRAQQGAPYPTAGPYYGGYGGNPAMGPPQSPPMLSHPMISPFDNLFEQHVSSDGLWFRGGNPGFGPSLRPRDYFFNVDYARTKTRDLEGLVGAEGVQTYLQQNDPLNDDIVDGMAFYKYFDAASAGLIPDLRTDGIKVNGGFWNPDGSGMIFDVVWNAPSTSVFDARHIVEQGRLPLVDTLRLRTSGGVENGAPFSLGGRTDMDLVRNDILAPGVIFDDTDSIGYGFFGSTFDVLDRTVMNLYGMPVLSGNTPIVQTGETMPYDLEFVLQHSITNLGASAAFASTPILERGNFKLRTTVGGRYYRIDETFKFYGASSLLYYNDNGDADTPVTAKVFPVGNGIDEDNDFIPDNPDEDGDQTFVPIDGFSNHLIVDSYIDSFAVSDLAGPEIGLHYELGATDGLTINGTTRFAAMINNERMKLRGDNIGNALGVEVIPDPVTGANIAIRMFDTDRTNGPTQNAFTDSKSSTHFSPLIEQGLNAQIPIFSRVPVLNEMNLLEGARLNLGWSYLWIYDVADPNDSIVYQSSPITGIFPIIQAERGVFSQNTFSIGLNWQY